MRTIRAVSLLCAIASPALAQVFVVDVNNGPGTNFTSIAAAVAAVPDGAVLAVRAGPYGPFTIQNKSLSVIGVPGVVIDGGLSTAITISGIGANQFVTLRRLGWEGTLLGTMRVQGCAGTVVIDSCDGDQSGSYTGGRLVVSSCQRVFVRNTNMHPMGFVLSAIEASTSSVFVSDCWLSTASWVVIQNGGRVQLTNCQLASSSFGFDMVTVNGGTMLIHGGTTLTGSQSMPTPAIVGNGTVVLDPSTSFISVPAPFLAPSLTVDNRAIPELAATTQAIGGTANAMLFVPIGAAGALWVGAVVAPYFVPTIADPFLLHPGSALQAVGTSPIVSSSYPVPNSSMVLGIQMGWQGITLDANGTLAASNPAVYVHY